MEKTKLVDVINQPAKDFTTEGNASLPPYFGGKDTRLFEILQDNSSKVLDENGEPRVCYHGTRSGVFKVFDTDGKGKTHDTGAFFAERVRNAGTYSGSGRFGTFCRANADALCGLSDIHHRFWNDRKRICK